MKQILITGGAGFIGSHLNIGNPIQLEEGLKRTIAYFKSL